MSGESEFTLIHEGIPDLLPMTDRSSGIHISQIIHDICIRKGDYEESLEPPDMTRLQVGAAWENALAWMYSQSNPDRWIRPGEQELDNLFGTPDFCDLMPELLTGKSYKSPFSVDEIKCTWMSALRHDITSPKFWKFKTQNKSYCKMMGTNLGRIGVLYVNGNYEKYVMGTPIYRIWEREYEDRELNDNWQMLLQHAETL